MDSIQSAIAKKDILDSLRPIDPEREQIIMQKFRLDWNYHSNHIEGNSLSYGETKALLLFNITAQGKPLKDHFEIKGHNEAIDWVLEIIRTKGDLTEHFIRQLHEVLLKEPYMSDAMTADGKATKKKIEIGKYKTQPNHVQTVTGEIFRFASPEETPAKMHDLLTWYNEKKEQEATNPILLAAEFHYRFVRIHPFDDGNGRMARMLMNFILMQYGYPPVIIKSEDKKNYISVLEQADTTSIAPFIEYIAVNLDNSLDIMIAGAQGDTIEEPEDLDKELLLLEQQINDTSKKIQTHRNQQIIEKLINSSISKIKEEFSALANRVKAYYKISDLFLEINNTHKSIYWDQNSLTRSIGYTVFKNAGRIFYDIQSLTLSYEFKSFLPLANKGPQLKIENFQSKISVDFFPISYQISNSAGDKIIKAYSEELSDQEINFITKKEILAHMKFIAQKKIEAEELES